MKNTQIKLVGRPEEQGLSAKLFKVDSQDVPALAEGEVLVKQTHMSLDPAMIGWMSADTESYVPRVELNEVMRSFGLGEVVESKSPLFSAGDKVTGGFNWQEYAVCAPETLNKLQADLPAEMVLSVFALPGLTATHGLFNVGKPKAGETIVISGAAGSVGSIVGQLAKAEGLNVIGVAGSTEKCGWLVDELGFDGAINYKTDDIEARLAELAPNGIDIYFENTGGPIQHAAFARMNAFGRMVVCGMIADYTAQVPSAGPNWVNIVKKRLTIQGFTMPDHLQDAPQLIEQLTPYVMKGQVKYRSHVLSGLESAMEGLNLFMTGGNTGKLIVKL